MQVRHKNHNFMNLPIASFPPLFLVPSLALKACRNKAITAINPPVCFNPN